MKHVFKPCGLDFKSFNKNAKQPSLKLNFSANCQRASYKFKYGVWDNLLHNNYKTR